LLIPCATATKQALSKHTGQTQHASNLSCSLWSCCHHHPAACQVQQGVCQVHGVCWATRCKDALMVAPRQPPPNPVKARCFLVKTVLQPGSPFSSPPSTHTHTYTHTDILPSPATFPQLATAQPPPGSPAPARARYSALLCDALPCALEWRLGQLGGLVGKLNRSR
jgi:hypothetical protein